MEGFRRLMAEQKQRSRDDAAGNRLPTGVLASLAGSVQTFGFFPWGGPPPPSERPVGISWTQATPCDGLAEWHCWCGQGGESLSISVVRFHFWLHRRRCKLF